MKQIRKGVFETNSSSTHSIALGLEMLLDTIKPNADNNIIFLTGGEFGWEWAKYNDALTKANYCAVDQKDNPDRLNMLKEVIREQTGCERVIIDISNEYKDSNFSYVDHQSAGTSGGYFISKDKLRDFIFNKNSYLFIGNDNSLEPPNFYDPQDTKYKYIFKIEGTDVVEKLQNKPTTDELYDDIIQRIMQMHPQCSDSFDYSPNPGYEYTYWDCENVDGGTYNSLSEIKNNIILLFKRECQYQGNKYIGDKVIKTIKLKFSIEKI